jgi:hypothetical protein
MAVAFHFLCDATVTLQHIGVTQMPQKYVPPDCNDERNAGTMPINRGSPLNQRAKPKSKSPERLDIHGQPGNRGRRDSDRRK